MNLKTWEVITLLYLEDRGLASGLLSQVYLEIGI